MWRLILLVLVAAVHDEAVPAPVPPYTRLTESAVTHSELNKRRLIRDAYQVVEYVSHDSVGVILRKGAPLVTPKLSLGPVRM